MSAINEVDFVSKYFEIIKEEHGFGFSLKDKQVSIVNSICNKQDVFVSLPTGYGKTICMILPPLLLDKADQVHSHCAIVVSPLKALIHDQELFLCKHKVEYFTLEGDEDIQSMIRAKVIFSSPEAINTKRWKDAIALHLDPSMIIYDECHCVTKWGSSFRPDYLKVGQLQSWFDSPVMALSATITKPMQKEIFAVLGLKEDCKVVSLLPDRPNIRLVMHSSTEHHDEELAWITSTVSSLRDKAPKTLIFTPTIDICQRLYNNMVLTLMMDAFKDNVPHVENRLIEMFHRGTDSNSKERITEQFKKQDSIIRIVVCTIAFGIGIDIANVRNVIIWGLPDSILDMWQLIGRGGRDGLTSFALVYAYSRSLNCSACRKKECNCRFTDKTVVVNAFQGNLCVRRTILKEFVLDSDTEAQLPGNFPKEVCDTKTCITICNCDSCRCCSGCSKMCNCEVKLDTNIVQSIK